MPKKREKKLIKKEEKYIREIVTSAGSHILKIEIRKYDQTFRKNIMIEDFDTPGQALNIAVRIRDENLNKLRDDAEYRKKHADEIAGVLAKKIPTVRELYADTFELFPVRIKTRYRHEIFFRNGIGKYADYPIDEVKAADIQKTLNEYGQTHTARQTQGLLAIWRRIYKAAVMNEINVSDKTIAVRIPECMEDNPRPKSISPEDLDTFCEALKEYNSTSIVGSYRSHAIYYAIQIMRYCGVRPAEAFSLTREDIHLTEGYITINKEVRSTVDSYTEIGRTKTGKSKREIPIPSALRPHLEECLQWSRHDMLLADYHGNLLEIDDVDVLVRNVRKKAKVNFTLYMLRHQFSTDLFNQGVNPAITRDLMGHESATMSLDYAITNEKDRIKAINERRFS